MSQLRRLVKYLAFVFIALGVLVFGLYWTSGAKLSLVLIGPPLYLSYFAENFLNPYWPALSSKTVRGFALLLPVTAIYFGGIGFLARQLFYERGFMKFVTLFALAGFVVYIHMMAWQRLSGYFGTPDLPV